MTLGLVAENAPVQMSVILIEPSKYKTIRQTVQHLSRQTVKDRLEIVFVVNSANAFDLDRSEVSGFGKVRIVEIDAIDSLARARAAGIRAATSAIVALGENHSFPDPNWAEALIKAHQQSWAAVGPTVNIADPRSAVGWAMHFLTYGRWSDPTPAGVIDDLPGHNSSYKRSILVNYGSELENMLHAETTLHWDLRRKDYQLYLEPAAKTYHHSSTRLASILPELLYYGRAFAAARARKWHPIRRLLFGVGALLIPLIRLKRVVYDVRRSRQNAGMLFRIVAVIPVGLIASAIGEMMGYLMGTGVSIQKLSHFELDHYSRDLA